MTFLVAALLTDVSAERPNGGRPVAGWRLELQLAKGSLRERESLLLKVCVRNLAPSRREFPKILRFDLKGPKVNKYDTDSEGCIVLRQVSGPEPADIVGSSTGRLLRPAREFVMVPPGGMFFGEIMVDAAFLNPGTFDVRFVLYSYSKTLLHGVKEDLVSNTWRFRVLPNDR
jgi:hypothetical protein